MTHGKLREIQNSVSTVLLKTNTLIPLHTCHEGTAELLQQTLYRYCMTTIEIV